MVRGVAMDRICGGMVISVEAEEGVTGLDGWDGLKGLLVEDFVYWEDVEARTWVIQARGMPVAVCILSGDNPCVSMR